MQKLCFGVLRGSAAASSSDPQPLAENQGRVEGTASASSGGQKSMAVQQWEAQLDSMGCRDLLPAVANTPEAAVALETASNFVQELARGGATGDSGGGSARENAPEENDGRESEATNQWEATISKVSR